ncbi:barstar family protein [Streptomyces sp. DG2A-72]|uniref:barstar family protein n=1 Tax=Streptomyces sp. DG2A-72 TaxID=3051386 RepID=UPI00265C058F|nr:barstar family protein [Streptomyces sp. DG2A-72]MDO0933817.1 barstar family protein [Streptomyces sp. DG2A-72]
MQGREMSDVDSVFTQFYENLRLPDYFGWNWNALYDCLSDLNWLATTHFLLIVDDAESVLSESPEERPVFFRILLRSAEHWANKPNFPHRTKSTFRVILLCDPVVRGKLSGEVARAQELL